MLWKCFYRHYCPKGSFAGTVFSHRQIFWFFTLQGRHIAPIKLKFCRVLPAKFHFDRLRGVGLRPQNFENLEFYQYILPLRGGLLVRFLQNLYGICMPLVYIILPNLSHVGVRGQSLMFFTLFFFVILKITLMAVDRFGA